MNLLLGIVVGIVLTIGTAFMADAFATSNMRADDCSKQIYTQQEIHGGAPNSALRHGERVPSISRSQRSVDARFAEVCPLDDGPHEPSDPHALAVACLPRRISQATLICLSLRPVRAFLLPSAVGVPLSAKSSDDFLEHRFAGLRGCAQHLQPLVASRWQPFAMLVNRLSCR
jgi:hypothetical protein